MELILPILGSSVISAVIGYLFTRKQESVKFISNERSKWREKVECIAKEIQQCTYSKKGRKELEKQLVQLQMNLDTYGKYKPEEFEDDGHIWENINQLRNAKSYNEFESTLSYKIVLVKKK